MTDCDLHLVDVFARERYAGNQLAIVESGMDLLSYGVYVTVEIADGQPDDEATVVSVDAEREVASNLAVTPETYESRFLVALERLRGTDPEAALERAREGTETSNEVPSVGDLRYGSSSSRMKTALAAGTLFGLVSLVALI